MELGSVELSGVEMAMLSNVGLKKEKILEMSAPPPLVATPKRRL